MPAKAISPKDKKIKAETRRLNTIFESLDKNKRATVQPLIRNAAFTAVTLDDLQEIINSRGEDGYVQIYQNGANQHGVKQSAEMELHISLTRNYTTIIKQLLDLCPPAARENSKLLAMRQRRV
ncbi:MAG: hypothetical protein FWB80_00110 [Defluviitaleaceae bacterium]|nr:hypothetical protein [Defluviitaleaceae bacterium]